MDSPIDTAKRLNNRAQVRLGKREQNIEQRRDTAPPTGATYKGYLADEELHIVRTFQGERATSNLLTNAGLDAGDSLEWIDRANAFDTMPRYTPEPDLDPVIPEPDPVWGILIKRRAYIGSVSVNIPPRPPRYSDPVPASWSMVYRSTTYQRNAINNWDRSATVRYCEGTSLELCGVEHSNKDRDPYCRRSLADWRFIPQDNRVELGLPGNRCHFSFAIKAKPGQVSYGGYLPLGGIVIGCLAFSPDGLEAVPSSPPYTLPRLYYKADNPEYGPGQAPPGEAYLSCDVEQGPEVDLGWELVEVLPFSDYVPSKLIDPGFPGGTAIIPQYESQYWLVTPQATTLVATVEDGYYPPEFETPRGFPKATTVLLGAEENAIHIDFKISEPDFIEETTSIVLKHLQFRGAVAEVEESDSWRRLFTNSTTNKPLPGETSHPCISAFQAFADANIDERERRLIRTPPITPEELKAGKTVDLKIWRLVDQEVCNISPEPDEIKQLTLPPFSEAAIGVDPQDEYNWGIVGFVVYG